MACCAPFGGDFGQRPSMRRSIETTRPWWTSKKPRSVRGFEARSGTGAPFRRISRGPSTRNSTGITQSLARRRDVCDPGSTTTIDSQPELERSEETMDVDVAVLGGGPGGYTAAIRAAQLGAKV